MNALAEVGKNIKTVVEDSICYLSLFEDVSIVIPNKLTFGG